MQIGEYNFIIFFSFVFSGHLDIRYSLCFSLFGFDFFNLLQFFSLFGFAFLNVLGLL